MPAKPSGPMLAPAPISSPPAEPPRATSRSADVQPRRTRCSADAMKSVKVFFLCSSLPSVYQDRPISPPPLTCAIADTKPPVEQRENGNGEGRVPGDLVAAVPVEQARRG